MDRVLVRIAEILKPRLEAETKELQRYVLPAGITLLEWARSTRDGDSLDRDVFEHDGTFTLEAFSHDGARGYCPIQQPLMMENLLFRPGLSESQTSQVIMRLAEHAVEEAYRRDAGEVYFLCKDQSTKDFAVRHGFVNVREKYGLETYRLNLLETYGR